MKNRKIILVDNNDKSIGRGEKMEVHRSGRLHRAFSVFIFNDKNELLLQKKTLHKYYTPSLWTNTCCSHPFFKNIRKDAEKRLKKEMEFTCLLKEAFVFKYRSKLDNGLVENEYDHVFFGRFNQKPKPNPEEVNDFRWVSLSDLKKDIKTHPKIYTPWIKVIINKYGVNLWNCLKP